MQEYLTRKEAAAYLRVQVNTLRQWAHCRKNVPYRKHGKLAIYLKSDLDAWSQAQEIKPLRQSKQKGGNNGKGKVNQFRSDKSGRQYRNP